MAIHHIDVDQPRAGVHDLRDLGTEPGEIGGEDRGRDPAAGVRLAATVGAQTGFSIEWPQCWQERSSSVDMRTIVWCSPQFGQPETSS